MSTIFNNTIAAMKSQYVPTVDNKIKMTINGDLACPSGGEYRAFVDGELTNVPEELLIDIPVYRISKPIDQVQPGDIIKTFEKKTMKSGYVDPEGKYTYRKVLEVKDGSIKTISFSGSKSTQTPVKDFFFGQKTASVVVNLFGGMMGGNAQTPFGNMNPMMLMALMKDDCGSKFDKILPFMMMNQNGIQGFNPMMLALMGDGDMSDAVMLMMMQQNGGLQNLFTPVAPATEAATEA